MMEEMFLEVNNVVKRYAAHTALNGVSIRVPKGQVFGLLGPNGAGKTTLIRIINRITAPDSGNVRFDGHSFRAEDVMQIGYLPEERGLYKKMKVGEQAIYLAQLKGLSKAEAKRRLTQWFEKFDIMPWWDKKLEELSKGMQQKVQFIITVLHEPPLLIFDEPFSGFDPVNAEMLKREILEFRDKGHTIIFSTHNMASVEEICDHIALINHSQVVLNGAVQTVREQFKTHRYHVSLQTKPGEPLEELKCDLYHELSREQESENRYSLCIRKQEEVSNSAFLQHLAQHYEILSFTEEIPSMHDIFIQVVGNNSPKEN